MSANAEKLVLGTAQLGLSYGIANQSGKPDRRAAVKLVHTALAAGVCVLDTARCYGDSEDVLKEALSSANQGNSLRTIVITKVNTPSAEEAAIMNDAALERFAEDGVRASCCALGIDRIPVLLIREAWPLEHPNGFWRALLRLRTAGVIGILGLSAQTVEEGELAAGCSDIGHLQIPFNVLDYRWRETSVLDRISDRPDLTVHVRSVFLQGLLLGGDGISWPAVANGVGPAVRDALLTAQQAIGRSSVADLCIAYVLSYPQIAGLVLGMETAKQLEENLALVSHSPLSAEERLLVDSLIPRVPSALLNPGLW
ncbi:aldo/keto reductase [Thalassospira lohafexi]|uniref:NADP-dependent oxidoreductase domain-containing protein n=1 Tax=Thalassospira lohafexi TaxID=744227 RepID=A0A2N3L6Z5_9PROT|nr:aldo/keto reductase [Thalassospira lohafexi]PKR58516.1 hypothetical protein COO92_12380 [Thalassospira lohafexi]